MIKAQEINEFHPLRLTVVHVFSKQKAKIDIFVA
jgi:hypothetical protein